MCLSFNIRVIKHSVILLGSHLLVKKHIIPWKHSYRSPSALEFLNDFRNTYPSSCSQGPRYSSPLCWACHKSPRGILLDFVIAFALQCSHCFLICFSRLFLNTKDCVTNKCSLRENFISCFCQPSMDQDWKRLWTTRMAWKSLLTIVAL